MQRMQPKKQGPVLQWQNINYAINNPSFTKMRFETKYNFKIFDYNCNFRPLPKNLNFLFRFAITNCIDISISGFLLMDWNSLKSVSLFQDIFLFLLNHNKLILCRGQLAQRWSVHFVKLFPVGTRVPIQQKDAKCFSLKGLLPIKCDPLFFKICQWNWGLSTGREL